MLWTFQIDLRELNWTLFLFSQFVQWCPPPQVHIALCRYKNVGEGGKRTSYIRTKYTPYTIWWRTKSIDCQAIVQDPACPTLEFPGSLDALPWRFSPSLLYCSCMYVCICTYIYLSYSIKCVLACVSAYLLHGCPKLSPPTAPCRLFFFPPSFFLWHPVGAFSVYHQLIGRMTWHRTTDPSGTSPFSWLLRMWCKRRTVSITPWRRCE